MKPADRELRVTLQKLDDIAFELDELSMSSRERRKLQQMLRHAGEAAGRAVKFAREEKSCS